MTSWAIDILTRYPAGNRWFLRVRLNGGAEQALGTKIVNAKNGESLGSNVYDVNRRGARLLGLVSGGQ